MFSGLAAAIGVGSGSLATAGAVAGSIIGTNKIGGHQKQYVLAVYDSTGGRENMRFIEGNDLENNSFSDQFGEAFKNEGRKVAYGDNMWVAIGYNDTDDTKGMMYSYDGKLWRFCEGEYFDSNNIGTVGVVYGSKQKLWVAAGRPSTTGNVVGTILTSPDGITWSEIISGGFNLVGYGVAYGGGRYLATGTDSSANHIKSSDDGKNWTNCSFPANARAGGGYNDAAYGGNGKWVAVGDPTDKDYTILRSSNNGETFKKIAIADVRNGVICAKFADKGNTVVYGNGIWVAGGDGGSDSTENILWCDDDDMGFWNETTADGAAFFTGNVSQIIYDGVRFIAIGSGGGGQMATSPDGKHWTQIVVFPPFNGGNGIAYKP